MGGKRATTHRFRPQLPPPVADRALNPLDRKTPTSSVSYSACTNTKSCFVFQLNALERSASRLIPSVAWSAFDLNGASFFTSVSCRVIWGSDLWRKSVRVVRTASVATTEPKKVTAALARAEAECIAPGCCWLLLGAAWWRCCWLVVLPGVVVYVAVCERCDWITGCPIADRVQGGRSGACVQRCN